MDETKEEKMARRREEKEEERAKRRMTKADRKRSLALKKILRKLSTVHMLLDDVCCSYADWTEPP